MSAAIAELAWSAERNRVWEAFAGRLEVHARRLRSLGIAAADFAAGPRRSIGDGRVEDREMDLCGNAIVLALEDDAPLTGERESFLVDIMNPCWILRDADLRNARTVRASVGQLPFNFEIGDDIHNVVVEVPESGEGALRVRLGACDGPVVAELPLAPAIGRHAVTTLPDARLALPSGVPESADLCFSFTRHDVEPMWVIDWVQLLADRPGGGE